MTWHRVEAGSWWRPSTSFQHRCWHALQMYDGWDLGEVSTLLDDQAPPFSVPVGTRLWLPTFGACKTVAATIDEARERKTGVRCD